MGEIGGVQPVLDYLGTVNTMLVIIGCVIVVRREFRVNFLQVRSEGGIATINQLENGRRGQTAPGLSASGQENSRGWIQELD